MSCSSNSSYHSVGAQRATSSPVRVGTDRLRTLLVSVHYYHTDKRDSCDSGSQQRRRVSLQSAFIVAVSCRKQAGVAYIVRDRMGEGQRATAEEEDEREREQDDETQQQSIQRQQYMMPQTLPVGHAKASS